MATDAMADLRADVLDGLAPEERSLLEGLRQTLRAMAFEPLSFEARDKDRARVAKGERSNQIEGVYADAFTKAYIDLLFQERAPHEVRIAMSPHFADALKRRARAPVNG